MQEAAAGSPAAAPSPPSGARQIKAAPAAKGVQFLSVEDVTPAEAAAVPTPPAAGGPPAGRGSGAGSAGSGMGLVDISAGSVTGSGGPGSAGSGSGSGGGAGADSASAPMDPADMKMLKHTLRMLHDQVGQGEGWRRDGGGGPAGGGRV